MNYLRVQMNKGQMAIPMTGPEVKSHHSRKRECLHDLNQTIHNRLNHCLQKTVHGVTAKEGVNIREGPNVEGNQGRGDMQCFCFGLCIR